MVTLATIGRRRQAVVPAFDVAASPIPGVQLQKIVDIVEASRTKDNAALF